MDEDWDLEPSRESRSEWVALGDGGDCLRQIEEDEEEGVKE